MGTHFPDDPPPSRARRKPALMGCKSIRVQPRPAGSAKGGIENRPAKAQDGTAASPPGETCQRRPIFPGSFPPSIFGTNELNFRVRNGNGWTLIVKDTDYCIESGYGSRRAPLIPISDRRRPQTFPTQPTSAAGRTSVPPASAFRPRSMSYPRSLRAVIRWCTFRDSNPGPTD